jgi:hypothetical protein
VRPRREDHTIVRGKGASFLLVVAVPNEDDLDGPEILLDLTGCAIKLMAKQEITDDDGDAVINLAVGSGIVISNQTTDRGEAVVTVPASATSALPNKTAWLEYDVQVTEPGKDPVQTQHGTIAVVPAVRQGA